jgi:CubicO group peptidase (beta-lactamase class C family)
VTATADPGPELPAVSRALEAALREEVAPAVSAVVLHGGEVVHQSSGGWAQREPEQRRLGAGDLFDVASLTKVMATTSLAALFHAEGRLALDTPVASVLPAFAANEKGAVTVRHLLVHSSGLPAWRPYFELAAHDELAMPAFHPPEQRPRGTPLGWALFRARRLLEDAVLEEVLEARPGQRALYCDSGFMALGWVLEALGGASLAALCRSRIFEPLGMADTFFIDDAEPEAAAALRQGRAFVATERCVHRQEINCGLVNDDNAWAAGGVAGHAGLFSTAQDVARLGQAWLDALHGRGSLFAPEVARAFAQRDATIPGSTRAIGWDTPSAEGSSIGARLGRGARGAIGHLGFTGTSLWLDVDRELVCVLLTNRCHPSRDNQKIRAFRPRFHDAVAEALGI